MKFRHLIVLATCVALTGFALFKFVEVSTARSRTDRAAVEFFQGTWECKLQNRSSAFRWTVGSGQTDGWLKGIVEASNHQVSHDFWRVGNGKIERFAFAINSTFVQIESDGWKADQLIFSGTLNRSGETFPVRETITKIDDNTFRALWEQQGKDQNWATLTDEQCHK